MRKSSAAQDAGRIYIPLSGSKKQMEINKPDLIVMIPGKVCVT
jgi:hypothetical protein